jgi:hypothetical protein
VLFTAAASGGSASSYDYQYMLSENGGPFSVVQTYSANPDFNWNTPGTEGKYHFRVNARQVGSTGPAEATTAFTYVFAEPPPPPGPATGVTLTASPESPQAPGTQVTFTASASGGSGTYEYQFWFHNGTSWSMVKDFSVPGDSWTWNTTGQPAGTYQVTVYARNAGSTSLAEATFGPLPYALGSPATGVTLAASPASPAAVGDNVVFTASASGGSGTYEYQYWFFNGTTWSMVKDFGVPGNVWTWNTTGQPAGTYQVTVYARNAGSTSLAEAIFGPFPYVLQ